jgi:hypothetical protein
MHSSMPRREEEEEGSERAGDVEEGGVDERRGG